MISLFVIMPQEVGHSGLQRSLPEEDHLRRGVVRGAGEKCDQE
jgi:hypothetical protein